MRSCFVDTSDDHKGKEVTPFQSLLTFSMLSSGAPEKGNSVANIGNQSDSHDAQGIIAPFILSKGLFVLRPQEGGNKNENEK